MLLAQRSKLKSLSSKTILSKPPSLLEQIQNVKLKSPKPLSPKIYSAQHPVLRELVETVRRKRETTITELYIWSIDVDMAAIGLDGKKITRLWPADWNCHRNFCWWPTWTDRLVAVGGSGYFGVVLFNLIFSKKLDYQLQGFITFLNSVSDIDIDVFYSK